MTNPKQPKELSSEEKVKELLNTPERMKSVIREANEEQRKVMELSVLEQIKAGFDINYSATIEMLPYGQGQFSQVIGIPPEEVGQEYVKILSVINSDGSCVHLTDSCTYKIIGYKYMGELGGNKEIEKGQKFRIKYGLYKGQIGKFKKMNNAYLCLDFDDINTLEMFKPSKIEPIFTP